MSDRPDATDAASEGTDVRTIRRILGRHYAHAIALQNVVTQARQAAGGNEDDQRVNLARLQLVQANQLIGVQLALLENVALPLPVAELKSQAEDLGAHLVAAAPGSDAAVSDAVEQWEARHPRVMLTGR
jgi:transcriptional regulator GlxA family with amidase domain